jgi:hypothetical protein
MRLMAEMSSRSAEIQIGDTVRLRKPHPCGNFDWKIYRLGADIGLECTRCGRRVLLDRRTLSRRMKTILPKTTEESKNL